MKNKHTLLLIITILYFSGEIWGQTFSVSSWSYGIKLKTPLLEARYFQKEQNQNYGICLVTDGFWKHYPCQVKIGKMTCGGLWSFLKSPELSFSYTPFYSGKSGIQEMTTTLCSTGSFPEEVSYYIQTGYSDSKKVLSAFTGNCWYNPEEKLITGSTSLKINLSKQTYLGFSGMVGKSCYSENSSSTWFTNGAPYFVQGQSVSGAGEVCFVSKYAKLLFLTGIYTSPEGEIKEVFRTENQFKIPHFSFTLSAFYNPWNNLFLPDESFLKQELDLRVGVIYSQRCKSELPLIIKTGANVYSKIVFSESNHPLKFGYGVQISNPFMVTTLGAVTGVEINEKTSKPIEFENQKLNLESKLYFQKATATFSGDWTLTSYARELGFSHKYKAAVEAGKRIKCTAQAGFSQSFKKGEITANALSSSINLQVKAGGLNISGKIGFNLDL